MQTTEPEPVITDEVEIADLRQLATVTILRAIEDAREGDLVQKLDAVLWLTGPDLPWWCEWAGMPFADIWQAVTSGKARRAPVRRANVRRSLETV